MEAGDGGGVVSLFGGDVIGVAYAMHHVLYHRVLEVEAVRALRNGQVLYEGPLDSAVRKRESARLYPRYLMVQNYYIPRCVR